MRMSNQYYDNIEETFMNRKPSYEISMTHENGFDEWCDLKIYSRRAGQIQESLVQYELKLKKLWDVFCE